MTIKVINSYWSTERSSDEEQITKILGVIEKMFPEATFWDARPNHPTGPEDKFEIIGNEMRNYDGRLSALWQSTILHFAKQGKDLNEIGVESSTYSDVLNLAIRVYFDDFQMSIDVEPDCEKNALKDNLDKFLMLLRELGTCNTIGGWWLRNKSAFTGDPALLYEPKIPFAKFYDPLRYDEVIDQVRELRESVRAVVSPAEFMRILQELGLEVDALPGGRVFVRLGDPLDKNGIEMMKKIEQKISPLLKKK